MTLHGRAVTYAQEGSGPVLLLIHGMAGTYENWREVIAPLARHHTVIAPDLPGHGASESGGGDYSLGSLASGLRDLLVALGHERATLVGHSLGGGIAMQFAYQFPEITERLVLVSSGGLGPEVSPVLRAAALPGADLFIAATAGPGMAAGTVLGRAFAAVGFRPNADVAEVARGYASLADPTRRAAFLATLRAVVGTGGQRVHAGDRLYLADGVPVLIIWGEHDSMIPAHHGEHAHEAIVGSKLEIFSGVGHLPQLEAPARFVEALERFLSETEPAQLDAEEWRARLAAASANSGAAVYRRRRRAPESRPRCVYMPCGGPIVAAAGPKSATYEGWTSSHLSSAARGRGSPSSCALSASRQVCHPAPSRAALPSSSRMSSRTSRVPLPSACSSRRSVSGPQLSSSSCGGSKASIVPSNAGACPSGNAKDSAAPAARSPSMVVGNHCAS